MQYTTRNVAPKIAVYDALMAASAQFEAQMKEEQAKALLEKQIVMLSNRVEGMMEFFKNNPTKGYHKRNRLIPRAEQFLQIVDLFSYKLKELGTSLKESNPEVYKFMLELQALKYNISAEGRAEAYIKELNELVNSIEIVMSSMESNSVNSDAQVVRFLNLVELYDYKLRYVGSSLEKLDIELYNFYMKLQALRVYSSQVEVSSEFERAAKVAKLKGVMPKNILEPQVLAAQVATAAQIQIVSEFNAVSQVMVASPVTVVSQVEATPQVKAIPQIEAIP